MRAVESGNIPGIREANANLRQFQDKLKNFRIRRIDPIATDGDEIELTIGGTAGMRATVSLENVRTTATIDGVKGMGTLTQTSGFIPFKIRFQPNGNYGQVTVKAKLDGLTTSATTDLRVFGQTQERALDAEETRYQMEAKAVDLASDVVAGIIGAVLGAIIGAVLTRHPLGGALGAIIGAIIAVAMQRWIKDMQREVDRVHKKNEALIKRIPKTQ